MKYSIVLKLVLATAISWLLQSSLAKAQWIPYKGLSGGSVLSIAKMDSEIFIGVAGGVFASKDDGFHWQQRSNGLPFGVSVGSLVVKGPYICASTSIGFYRSADRGTNWISMPAGSLDKSPGAFLASNSHRIYWQSGDFIYSSQDASHWSLMDTNLTQQAKIQCSMTVGNTCYWGGRWILSSDSTGAMGVSAVPPADRDWDISALGHIGSLLFAFDNSLGLMRSTNNGRSWDVIYNSPIGGGSVISFAGSSNQLLAFTTYGNGFRTLDSGLTWQPVSFGPQYQTLNTAFGTDSEVFIGFSNYGFLAYSPATSTWSMRNYGLTNLKILAVAAVGDTIFAGAPSGLHSSADHGVTWLPISTESNPYSINAIAYDGRSLWAAGVQGSQLGYSTDLGNTWRLLDGIGIHNLQCLELSGSTLFAGGAPENYLGFGLTRTSNAGVSWRGCDDTITIGPSTVAVAASDSTVIAATTAGVFRSIDNGLNWSVCDQSFPISPPQCLAVGASDSMFYLSTLDAALPNPGAIFVSSNKGLTWSRPVTAAIPWRGAIIAFASYHHAMFATSDSCGVFLTIDSGQHWTNVSLGLSDSATSSLTVSGDELLVGTASGLWHRPIKEMIAKADVISKANKSPAIYPNPASHSVRVEWPGIDGEVTAKLIDETGATVLSRKLSVSAGAITIELNGIPAGAYRLELQSAKHQQTTPIAIQQ